MTDPPEARREDPGPSPALAPAAAELAATLARLAAALDAVAFRDLWRAVAVAATRLLFNEVATEARFSPAVRPCLPSPALPFRPRRSRGGVRDHWHAVAVAATRQLFNDVLTKARGVLLPCRVA